MYSEFQEHIQALSPMAVDQLHAQVIGPGMLIADHRKGEAAAMAQPLDEEML